VRSYAVPGVFSVPLIENPASGDGANAAAAGGRA
jgi:hypothetical protein